MSPTSPTSDQVAPWRQRFLDRLERSGRYRTWVLFAALAGMFATTFPVTILAVSLAPIADEFGSSETMMAWVISGPMLLSAVTFPLLGKLGDLRGHRTIFLFGFTGATIVAALTAFAWDPRFTHRLSHTGGDARRRDAADCDGIDFCRVPAGRSRPRNGLVVHDNCRRAGSRPHRRRPPR